MHDRTEYLGSHDIPAIAGVHPFKSPLDVYMDHVGLNEGRAVTGPMEWGLRLQGAILEKYASFHGVTLLPEQHIRHPDIPYLGSTPDGLDDTNKTVVECKAIRWKKDYWGDEGTDEVPEYVLLGAHHHLLCTRYDRATISVLFSGQDYQEFQVQPDEEVQAYIKDIGERFWKDHILSKKPPEIDGSDAAKRMLAQLFPRHVSDVRNATEQEIQLLLNLKEIRAELDHLGYEKAEHENKLKEAIGDGAGLRWEGGKVSWRKNKDSMKTDYKALCSALSLHVPNNIYAELQAAATTVHPGPRVFRTSWKNLE